ncbi:MAG: hypothetical protein L0I62_06225 [Gammaproteobacteria bacterium]|nr:hypothetical protein [Gammaproteobacteria bacterium]
MNDVRKRLPEREWSPTSVSIGIVIILIGIGFLLYNFNVRLPFLFLNNWWALFILIAAAGPLGQAFQTWRKKGVFDANVLHSLTVAAIIVTVSLFLFFGVDWSFWWPVFIIYGGLWAMTRSSAGKPRPSSDHGAD